MPPRHEAGFRPRILRGLLRRFRAEAFAMELELDQIERELEQLQDDLMRERASGHDVCRTLRPACDSLQETHDRLARELALARLSIASIAKELPQSHRAALTT